MAESHNAARCDSRLHGQRCERPAHEDDQHRRQVGLTEEGGAVVEYWPTALADVFEIVPGLLGVLGIR